MEENKIEKITLTTPDQISSLLIELTGVDIFEKTRVQDVIELRAFFCYLLKDKFYLGPTAISNFIRTQTKLKTYNHATVIHSLKMFKIYRAKKEEYFERLEGYFDINPDINYKKKENVANLLNQYMIVRNKYYYANHKIKIYEKKLEEFEELKRQVKTGFTENEILYRKLDKTEMKIYNERADLVLKSFNWQKPKDEYEIITCAS